MGDKGIDNETRPGLCDDGHPVDWNGGGGRLGWYVHRGGKVLRGGTRGTRGPKDWSSGHIFLGSLGMWDLIYAHTGVYGVENSPTPVFVHRRKYKKDFFVLLAFLCGTQKRHMPPPPLLKAAG